MAPAHQEPGLVLLWESIMAERYGQGFQRPVDFYTGKPFPDAPEMASIRNNLHGPRGQVVLRDLTPPPQPQPNPSARVTDNERG